MLLSYIKLFCEDMDIVVNHASILYNNDRGGGVFSFL